MQPAMDGLKEFVFLFCVAIAGLSLALTLVPLFLLFVFCLRVATLFSSSDAQAPNPPAPIRRYVRGGPMNDPRICALRPLPN